MTEPIFHGEDATSEVEVALHEILKNKPASEILGKTITIEERAGLSGMVGITDEAEKGFFTIVMAENIWQEMKHKAGNEQQKVVELFRMFRPKANENQAPKVFFNDDDARVKGLFENARNVMGRSLAEVSGETRVTVIQSAARSLVASGIHRAEEANSKTFGAVLSFAKGELERWADTWRQKLDSV